MNEPGGSSTVVRFLREVMVFERIGWREPISKVLLHFVTCERVPVSVLLLCDTGSDIKN